MKLPTSGGEDNFTRCLLHSHPKQATVYGSFVSNDASLDVVVHFNSPRQQHNKHSPQPDFLRDMASRFCQKSQPEGHSAQAKVLFADTKAAYNCVRVYKQGRNFSLRQRVGWSQQPCIVQLRDRYVLIENGLQ